MRGLKAVLCATAVLASLAFVPTAKAQIGISIGVPPVCPYGYYDYAPYACAPDGFYGSGYFYNGIFLGVGPWYHYGYNHGWGGYRFHGSGYGGRGYGYRGHAVTHAGYRGSYRGSGRGSYGGNRGGGRR